LHSEKNNRSCAKKKKEKKKKKKKKEKVEIQILYFMPFIFHKKSSIILLQAEASQILSKNYESFSICCIKTQFLKILLNI